ncbi:MAG: hypothetical protein ACRC5H_10660 [Treponemataceae bacterium]
MCWKCKKTINGLTGFRDECPYCHADVHCCKNCTFYSIDSHYECHEDVDERVSNKEKANFCEYFVIATANKKEESDTKKNALQSFNDLFKQ